MRVGVGQTHFYLLIESLFAGFQHQARLAGYGGRQRADRLFQCLTAVVAVDQADPLGAVSVDHLTG